MKIIIQAVLVNRNEPKQFPIEVHENNYPIVRRKLESQKRKIINYFKRLKREGTIKTIWSPKNKQMQPKIDELVKAKRQIKKSIEKIKEAFYR